jgi:hypothetical protein
MPNLCRAIESKEIQGRYSVAEVMGLVAFKPLGETIKTACNAVGRQATIEQVELSRLPGLGEQEKRKNVLADNGKHRSRYSVALYTDSLRRL